MNTDLRYAAALHGLGILNAEAMRTAIDSLMTDGFYADECLDALDSKPARMEEVLPAFKAALEHYQVNIPDREQAVWQLIHHHVSRIVKDSVDPWVGLRALIGDIYWEYDFHTATQRYLGDSHGIHHLIGIYWELDDIAGECGGTAVLGPAGFKPTPQHLQAIFTEAEKWLHIYGTQHAALYLPTDRREQ